MQSHGSRISRHNRSNSRLRHPSTLDVWEKPTKLRGDLLCFSDMGGDPHEVLAGTGVAFDDILAQTPISCTMIAYLFDRLANAADPGFGVACGRSIRLQYLGMLGYKLSNCGTIGELLTDWAHYSVIIGYPLSSSLSISGDQWKMEFRPRYPLSRAALTFCVESTLAGFTQSLFNMTGHRITLEMAAFPFAAPTDPKLYASIDARCVSFNVQTTSVSGMTADLALPIATADREARAICDAYCRDSLSDIAKSNSFADRLTATIARMSGPLPSEEQVCTTMGVSPRTMQRNLAADGLTFLRLVDELRRDRAFDALRQGNANKTIAYDLGYADTASFFRAFKRWTGARPGEWLSRPAT